MTINLKSFFIKIYTLVLGLFITFSMSSCLNFKTDEEIVDDFMKELITTMDNGDKEGFKKLFAINKIEETVNFDESIDELFEYYQGDFESMYDGGKVTYKDKTDEYSSKYFELSYDVITSIEIYRISMHWYTQYSNSNDMIGIWSFYIIKMSEDSTPSSSYRGDGMWTPGINIGKVYEK